MRSYIIDGRLMQTYVSSTTFLSASTPRGEAYPKQQYLGGIASGELDYLVWKPSEMEVRIYGKGAVIRYQSQLEIVVGGRRVPLGRYWHTDSYEKRKGRWQVVWSQATEVR